MDSSSELWPWLHAGFARAARFFLALLPYLDCSLFVSGFSCVQKTLTAIIICAMMLMKLFYKKLNLFSEWNTSQAENFSTALSTPMIIRERHAQRQGSSLLFFSSWSQFNIYLLTYPPTRYHTLSSPQSKSGGLCDLANHFSLMTELIQYDYSGEIY